MNPHVRWLIDIEQKAAGIYKQASAIFAADTDLSAFLDSFSLEEEEHAAFLEKISGIGPEWPDEVGRQFTLDVKESIGNEVNGIRNRLDSRTVTRRELFRFIVKLEFSEWNALFLYVINFAKTASTEFQRAAAGIERHRKELVKQLEMEPDLGGYLNVIRELTPIWNTRILILDDDREMLNLLAVFIKPYGDFEAVGSAPEAIDLLKQHHFDLIISDFEMPGMNGAEFYYEAIKLDPTIKDRILFYSGSHRRELHEFVENNKVSHLRKPADILDLRRAVIKILRG